jgi:hypothetical protein
MGSSMLVCAQWAFRIAITSSIPTSTVTSVWSTQPPLSSRGTRTFLGKLELFHYSRIVSV